jgi:PAS domain S-box-containing protein
MAGMSRLKFAVMAPFVAFVILLGIGLSLTQYLGHQRESGRFSAQMASAIAGSFRAAVESDAEMMAGMLGMLAERRELREALSRNDAESLLDLSRPTFDRLKRDNGITHFYFSDTRRVNLLRVHQPGRRGDVISRISTLEAERTRQAAHAIELGPLGTLTLRVVMPWHHDGVLIGFVELGKEIDGVFGSLHQQFGLEPMVFLSKVRLDRVAWEEGMRMLGRTPNWEQFSDVVMAVGNGIRADRVSQLRGTPSEEVALDDRWLMWLQLPIGGVDAQGGLEVGIILDVTSRHAEIRNFLLTVVQAVVVGSALVIALFWLVLDRVEDRLSRVEGRESHLGRILNLLKDRIHVFSTPGLCLVDGNAGALAQVGHPDDPSQLHFESVFDAMKREPVAELTAESEAITQEGMTIEAKGPPRPVETRFTYVADREQPVVVAVSTEIGERKRAEREVRKLWQALEQSPVSVMITDAQARIEYVNPAFIALTGYDRDDVLGRRPSLLKSGKTPTETHRALWAAITKGDAWTGDLINRRKDGRDYIDHSLISPVRGENGDITNYLAVKEDVTERDRHQRELAAMATALQNSNAELEQFAYVASHDLRQPLRMIVSYLSLIERRLRPLEGDVETFFDFAVNGAKRLDALILALLEYSRVGRSAELSPIELDQLIREAVEQAQPAIDDSGAEVEIDGVGSVPVLGNAIDLLRLFDNLIGNAIKYRTAGQPPRIRVGWRRQDKDWLVWVADNGIGLAPEDSERAFGMFQRLVDATQYEGTGIGLAVCKKIVTQHGGCIWVESEMGKGSTFFVTLPGISNALIGEAVS